MSQPDTGMVNHAHEMSQRFEDEFECEFLDVLEAYHDFHTPEDWPDAIVHVVFDGVDGHAQNGEAYGSKFTKPAVDYAREHGLEVMDHVVYVGYEATEERDYDTEVAIKVRFGVRDDYDE